MLTALKPRSAPAPKSSANHRSITDLYQKFEAAHAAFFEMNQRYGALLEEAGLGREQLDELDALEAAPKLNAIVAVLGPAWHKRFDRVTNKCNKIARQIVGTPAQSLAEIVLKLRIVAWEHRSGDHNVTLERSDDWTYTTAVEEIQAARILAGLHTDLRRLVAH